MSKEHFDLNRVQISGVIQKIWDWGEDIFFSLAFEENGAPRYVTMRLAGGMLGGKPVSLQPDASIHVTGHLVDSPHTETLGNFLANANKANFLEGVPDPSAWDEICIERVDTRINVETIQPEGTGSQNQVQVQGLVVKAWRGGVDTFARLAVYDQHTQIIGHNPQKGLPKRKPHYLTVRFPDGQAGGQPIKLRRRQRVRVSGSIHIHYYKQSLYDVLLRTQNAELLEGLAVDEVKVIAALRTSLYVLATSAIVLGSRGRQSRVQ